MKKYNIGVDLGGTKILCALVEKSTGKILFEVKKKTKKEKGNERIASRLCEALDELFQISKVKKDEINYIGIAIAGQVDRKNGIALNCCNLECCNLEVKKLIEEKYGIKTYLLNDVEAAAIGELLLGAGRGYSNIICIFIGTGVGSSIIINKKLYYGSSGTAGEIGHMIVDLNGRSCACGGAGCLEAYASRSAIETRIKGAVKKGRKSIITDISKGENISTKHIKKSLDAHDEVVSQYVNEAIEYLSGGIASVINFLNPELVILGGGLIQGIDDIYLKTIRLTKAKALYTTVQNLEFKKAQLNDYSGVVGASLLEEYQNDN